MNNMSSEIQLDNAYVINLYHRVDRLDNINNIFENKLSLNRIEAIKEIPGWVGCFKSHQCAIRNAKSLGLNTVLVLEDDCVLIRPDDFTKEWSEIKKWLDVNIDEWDIFLGGCTGVNPDYVLGVVDKNLGLVHLKQAYTAHFIYYNKNIYDKILNYNVSSNEYKPIDVFVPEICKNKILTKVPFLAKQGLYYSDIENKHVNYDGSFDVTESIIKSQLYRF